MVQQQQLLLLQQLTATVHRDLSPLQRFAVSALAIQTLHNRDVLETLIQINLTNPDG